MAGFVHLHTHSPYSFLDGASPLEDMVAKAKELGMEAMALTDHDSLSGAVEFVKLAGQWGIKPIVGAELTLKGGYHLTILAQNKIGYANLCHIITKAHLENPRLKPEVTFTVLEQYKQGLIALSGCRKGELATLCLNGHYQQALARAQYYQRVFGPNFYIELQNPYFPGNTYLNSLLLQLASHLKIEPIATNNCHYTNRENFILQDILTCIRTNTTLKEVHPERRLNSESYLKSVPDMYKLFSFCPQALHNTVKVADKCETALELNQPLFPAYPVQDRSAAAYLRELTYQGANKRYPKITDKIRSRLEHELKVITTLKYEDYFLIVWDLVQYAKSKSILHVGRGSAADSAVAYCLGITEVDAIERGLLFERFMSLERAQKPDIDIDFDTRYRDQVSAYVYQQYGVDKVAAVCTYNTFKARSAIREIGKVMGFDPGHLGVLAKSFPSLMYADQVKDLITKLPELRKSGIPFENFGQLFTFCEALAGFPKFLGTHLGGLVVCRYELTQVTPLQEAAKGVIVTQFDKDFVEDLGLIKLDLLSLRTLSAVQDTVYEIKQRPAERQFSYDSIPVDNKETYELLNTGKTIGIFQLESPAQRALQAKLGAKEMEDIIASVALIRPGPIKGNMVEPYINRRKGLEPVTYLHPKLEPILKKTYGVVLFQEQVLEIATSIAGFTPGEADRLRKVMSKARSKKEMAVIRQEFVVKAQAKGVERERAEQIYDYLEGYASYGFCEAHAAAFATTAYKTAFLLKYYPAQFFAAVLSNQPMGYYPVNTLCVEARTRGIGILPPDINCSSNRFTVEGNNIRIPLNQIKGVSFELATNLIEVREQRPFQSWRDVIVRTRIERDAGEALILAGAVDSFEPNRRKLLWSLEQDMAYAVRQYNQYNDKILAEESLKYPALADFSYEEKLYKEFELLSICVKEHFMAYWRRKFNLRGILTSKEVDQIKIGQRVVVGGLPIRPHRPPTKSGKTVVFVSLEDEYGLVDLVIFEKTYQSYGHYLFGPKRGPIKAIGRVQQQGNSRSITVEALSPLLDYNKNIM